VVAICGIDGSGKSLQCDLVARRARAEGLRVEGIEFPRYGEGFFADVVARYLRGEFAADPAAVSPYLAALPFALDRWQAAPTLRRWLEEGALVLCNRYVAANLAHQGAKIGPGEARRDFLSWLEELEYGILELPRPDLQVWLDMPPEVAVRLIGRKGRRAYLEGARDIHESSPSHLRAAGEVYRELAQGRPGWLTVECAPEGTLLPPERITDVIWSHLRPLLYDTERRG
jgi:dTMP kinase